MRLHTNSRSGKSGCWPGSFISNLRRLAVLALAAVLLSPSIAVAGATAPTSRAGVPNPWGAGTGLSLVAAGLSAFLSLSVSTGEDTSPEGPRTFSEGKAAGSETLPAKDSDAPGSEGEDRVDTARVETAAAGPQEIQEPYQPLIDAERGSVYLTENQIGRPTGRTPPPTRTPPAAIPGGELPGSSNFSFSVPVAGLPGRGVDAALSLIYNSRLWNKSKPTSSQTRMTYDVDGGWPAPGFTLGFGRVHYTETLSGDALYDLIDGDGTRRKLYQNPTGEWVTRDGTFITYREWPASTITYPDGTQTKLSGGYPVRITDRNGNFIQIFYREPSSKRIDYILDTLGREIKFRYDPNNNDLVAIEAPGYDGASAPRQVIRFYYETISLAYAGRFAAGVSVNGPSTARVLRYLYFPGTQTGYRYDYSQPYGMIFRVAQLRGMQVSTTDAATTGAVLADGQQAAVTEYNYPTSAAALTDAPAYTRRTDDWVGRTTSMTENGAAVPPFYTFAVNAQQGITTVTAPDGAVTETGTIVNPGGWNDGLVKYTEIKSGGQTLRRVETDWGHSELGSYNHRVSEVRVTDEVGRTTTTSYAYHPASLSPFNNVRKVTEKGFDGEELRRTEYEYVTAQAYRDRGLVHLPESVAVYKVGSSSPASLVEYGYDQSGLAACAGITMHDPAYGSVTARGNVTTVKTFADAANRGGQVVNTSTYDAAGNLLTQTANCCRKREFIYSPLYNYAYLTEEKRGDAGQLRTGTTYDRNTGLVRQVEDENGQVTTVNYNPASLRVTGVTRPDGGSTTIEHHDGLVAGPGGAPRYSFVKTTSALDSSGGAVREVSSWKYSDGRGAPVRSFAQTPDGYVTRDVEYDVVGRPYRSNNPYYSAALGTAAINQTTWTTTEFDGLGRVRYVTTPDGDRAQMRNVVQVEYAGNVTTVTDQAGRKRRQITDALGRLVAVDEPHDDGDLGTVASPRRRTSYEYDVLDNLTDVVQGSQQRRFRYDSLGRLVRQKQAEATAVFDDAGTYVPAPHAGASWSDVFIYDAQGQLTDSYDARNVHTNLDYTDGLNRLKEVTYSDGTPKTVYSYDESRAGFFNAGRLTRVETVLNDETVQTAQEFDYDRMGRVAGHRQKVGAATYTMAYGYNLAGALTKQTYPSGRVIEQVYDAAARLASVQEEGQQGRTFAGSMVYGPHGRLTSVALGNGTAQSFTYDAQRLQLTDVSLTKGSAVLSHLTYKYGQADPSTGAVDQTRNAGQVGSIEQSIGGQAQWQQRLTYDPLGRLKEVSERYGANFAATSYRMEYDYNRYGNRLMAAGQTQARPYTPVAATEIDEQSNRFVPTTGVSYDDAGNVISDQKFSFLNYSYDANGRMKSVTTAGGASLGESTYDGLGQRVRTTSSAGARVYVYDAFGRVVAEYASDTAAPAGGLKYVASDSQGSTRVVTDAGGEVLARMDYAPFGEELSAGIGSRTQGQKYGVMEGTRQRYTGLERDAVTGLDHTLWRKYESKSGRWTSPDPYGGSMSVADPQSFNRYAYVQNDPVNFIDPSGLMRGIWNLSQYGADYGFSGWSWGGFNFNNRPSAGLGILNERFNFNPRETYIKWGYEIEIDGEEYIRVFTTLVTSPGGMLLLNPAETRGMIATRAAATPRPAAPAPQQNEGGGRCDTPGTMEISFSGGTLLMGGSVALQISYKGIYAQVGGGTAIGPVLKNGVPTSPLKGLGDIRPKIGGGGALRFSRSTPTEGFGGGVDFGLVSRNWDSKGNASSSWGWGVPQFGQQATHTWRIINQNGCP